jgi:hypothetical protein
MGIGIFAKTSARPTRDNHGGLDGRFPAPAELLAHLVGRVPFY